MEKSIACDSRDRGRSRAGERRRVAALGGKLIHMNTFRISLPATSANLGPAFDAAALALDLTLRVEARKAKKSSIVATGRDSAICSRVENHLILNTYKEVLASEKKPISPLALTIANEFPI